MADWTAQFWAQLRDPETDQLLYLCPTTGKLVVALPAGAIVLPDDLAAFWELRDKATDLLYYYNPRDKRSTWSKPHSAIIVPLLAYQRKQVRAAHTARFVQQHRLSHDDDASFVTAESSFEEKRVRRRSVSLDQLLDATSDDSTASSTGLPQTPTATNNSDVSIADLESPLPHRSPRSISLMSRSKAAKLVNLTASSSRLPLVPKEPSSPLGLFRAKLSKSSTDLASFLSPNKTAKRRVLSDATKSAHSGDVKFANFDRSSPRRRLPTDEERRDRLAWENNSLGTLVQKVEHSARSRALQCFLYLQDLIDNQSARTLSDQPAFDTISARIMLHRPWSADKIRKLLSLVELNQEHTTIRDCTYIRICQLMAISASWTARLVGWQLLSIFVNCFRASKKLSSQLDEVLTTLAAVDQPVSGLLAQYCRSRIASASVSRSPPTIEDLQSWRKAAIMPP